MGKPRATKQAKKDLDTFDKGNSSQYETGTDDMTDLENIPHTSTHQFSREIYDTELTDITDTETEAEQEITVLRSKSKSQLNRKSSPRKLGSPRRSRRNRQNEIINQPEALGQGDSGMYGSIKNAINEMTCQIVSAIQNAFNGLTPKQSQQKVNQNDLTQSVTNKLRYNRSQPLNKVTKSKLIQPKLIYDSGEETDDDVMNSENDSDLDTNSIDTNEITQNKFNRAKSGVSTARLPSFTGKEKWEVWINRFEAVANLQNWDERTKLGELLTRLQGEAGDFTFDQMNSKILRKYSKLVHELKNRFGAYENKRTYKVQFNRRTQKPNENVADYAAELKRIYDKAYSNRDAKIRQEDLLQKFLMGLSDNDARIHVELSKYPKTIEEAVQEVITFNETTSRTEGFYDNGAKSKKVRQIKKNIFQKQTFPNGKKIENKQGDKDQTEIDLITVTKGELKEMFDKMYEEKRKIEDPNRNSFQRGQGNSFEPKRQQYNPDRTYPDRKATPIPVCYHCGQPGHYARNCYSNPNRKYQITGNKTYTPPQDKSTVQYKPEGYSLN